MKVKDSLTKAILYSLEKSIDGYIKFEDFIYNPHQYIYGYPRPVSKSKISQALKRLRERGVIDLVGTHEILIKLVVNSSRELDKKMKNAKKEWDGKWRLVIFDIPEKHRKARNLIRFKLKEWGFKKFQDSVWGTKVSCAAEFRKYIQEVGIQDWVMVVESDSII